MLLEEAERGELLLLVVAGTKECPGWKDQHELFGKGRPGQTELWRRVAGPWALLALGELCCHTWQRELL